MKKLHKGIKAQHKLISTSEEQLSPLCSNKDGNGCSSLDFNTEDEALRYLARLIVQIYLDQKRNEPTK